MCRHLAKREITDRFGVQAVPPGGQNRFEGQLRYRSDIRKTPVLVIDSGKTSFSEAGDAGFAQREQPGRLFHFVFDSLECFEVRLRFVHIGFWWRFAAKSLSLSQIVFHEEGTGASERGLRRGQTGRTDYITW